MLAPSQFGGKLACLVASLFAISASVSAEGLHRRPQQPRPTQSQVQQSTPTPSGSLASGTVKTPDGVPVPSAIVRLTNTDANKTWVSWTDESGKFDFPGLVAGHFRIEVSQIGFAKSSTEVQLPAPANKPVALVLRVATLAELNAPATTPAGNGRGGENPGAAGPGRRQLGGGNFGNGSGGNGQGANGQGGNGQGRFGGQGGPGGRGGFVGRGQLPPGVTNAINQGMAGGGFAQTDLTGEGNGSAEGEETIGQAGAAGQANAELSAGTAVASPSDSLLLQGATGQGLAAAGPGPIMIYGGPDGLGGPNGPGGLLPPAPGSPLGFGGAAGGPVLALGGSAGAPVGPGAFGVSPGGPGGGPVVIFGGPGGGPGGRFAQGGIFRGGPGGGGGRGGGRLGRQAVNRVRFSFYDRYTNSAFDARPYSITGNEFPKVSNYDERFGANMGGPLKIPHIYDGSNKTFFFANFQLDHAEGRRQHLLNRSHSRRAQR